MVFENENSNEWGQYIFLSDEENNVENKYLKSRQNYNTNSQKTYNIEYLNDADYYYSYDSLLSYESLVNKENIIVFLGILILILFINNSILKVKLYLNFINILYILNNYKS